MSAYLSLSIQAFRRMPHYYSCLKDLQGQGIQTVSAPVIAKRLHLNEVQVRKDLAAVSPSSGRPRTGFSVSELLGGISHCLGYDNLRDAVLVGAGHLGLALLSYHGFEECGVRIVAAFDREPRRVGRHFGKPVYDAEKLESLCRRLRPRIGIITVPAEEAQGVCDRLVASGVLAVWNFAPVHLSVPEHILVQNENMAVSLAMLSQHLAAHLQEEPAELMSE